MVTNCLRCSSQQIENDFSGCKIHLAKVGLVKATSDGIDRVYVDTFSQAWFIADQSLELIAERVG